MSVWIGVLASILLGMDMDTVTNCLGYSDGYYTWVFSSEVDHFIREGSSNFLVTYTQTCCLRAGNRKRKGVCDEDWDVSHLLNRPSLLLFYPMLRFLIQCLSHSI